VHQAATICRTLTVVKPAPACINPKSANSPSPPNGITLKTRLQSTLPPDRDDEFAAGLDRASAVLVVVVGWMLVVVGALTGLLGRLSTAWLTVVPTAAGSGAELLPAVCQREPDSGRQWRIVAVEVGEEGLPT
jgi:hypothetical protein